MATVSKVKDLLHDAEGCGYVPVLNGRKRKSLKTTACPKVSHHTAIVFRPKDKKRGKRVVRCPYCKD